MIVRCLIALLVIPCMAFADGVGEAPVGWVKSADGSYVHIESGIVCKATVGSYTLQRVDAGSDPNILGTCVYSGGAKRIGLFRIRKFVDGVGDTPLAIQNDRGLMGLAPMGPPGTAPVAAFRVGPGPTVDGAQLEQVVLTSRNKDLLTDCISQTLPTKEEQDLGYENFVKACPKPE